MTELTLPWPPKELSPNARGHWSKRAEAAKAYKQVCWVMAMEAGLELPVVMATSSMADIAFGKPPSPPRYHLWIDFYPPDRRSRDDDNMIASFKAGRDGLALALGIDDKRFVTHPFVSDQIGGFVKVRITSGVNE